jgi:hypothetical protein
MRAIAQKIVSTTWLAHQPALPGKILELAATGDGTAVDPAEHRPAADQPASHPLLPGYRRVRRRRIAAWPAFITFASSGKGSTCYPSDHQLVSWSATNRLR